MSIEIPTAEYTKIQQIIVKTALQNTSFDISRVIMHFISKQIIIADDEENGKPTISLYFIDVININEANKLLQLTEYRDSRLYFFGDKIQNLYEYRTLIFATRNIMCSEREMLYMVPSDSLFIKIFDFNEQSVMIISKMETIRNIRNMIKTRYPWSIAEVFVYREKVLWCDDQLKDDTMTIGNLTNLYDGTESANVPDFPCVHCYAYQMTYFDDVMQHWRMYEGMRLLRYV